MALSAKRRAFIEQYLRDFNAKQAAIRAGYSPRSAPVTAHRIMAHPEVQEAIKARLAELKMGTDEVLLRLAEQARAEYAEYIRPDGTVDLNRMLADGKGHLIRGTKWDRNNNLTIEFYDAQSALVHIGKAAGMFAGDGNVNVEVNFDLDGWKRQREERRQELADVEDPDDLEPVEDDECAPPDG